eukprot:6207397-Pleurochrysis_carterae.AAC.2
MPLGLPPPACPAPDLICGFDALLSLALPFPTASSCTAPSPTSLLRPPPPPASPFPKGVGARLWAQGDGERGDDLDAVGAAVAALHGGHARNVVEEIAERAAEKLRLGSRVGALRTRVGRVWGACGTRVCVRARHCGSKKLWAGARLEEQREQVANLRDGRDPNLRDTKIPSTESNLSDKDRISGNEVDDLRRSSVHGCASRHIDTEGAEASVQSAFSCSTSHKGVACSAHI